MSSLFRERNESVPSASLALATGVLALLSFPALGIAAGGWWFLFAFVVVAAAVVLGARARRALPAGSRQRRIATAGLVLGSIPVVWFALYMLIAVIA
jgi:hypothetical protein